MSYGRYHKIKRDQRTLFTKSKSGASRMYFIGLLTGLIILIPLVTMWRFDEIQNTALHAVNMAPPPTPLASDRANQAQDLFLAGDLEGAAIFWEQAVKQQPTNVSYLYEYGIVLIDLERSTEARVLGDQAIAANPNDPRGYAIKALSMMWTESAEAIPIAINGLELNQDFAPLHAALAVAYTNISRYQEALEEGARAVSLAPQDPIARRAFQYPLLLTGRYDDAIAQLEQAIAINPYIPAPYFELASLYRVVDNHEMAVAIFERLIEMNPMNAKAYLRLCETYVEVGLFQEGEPYCTQSLEVDPQYGAAYAVLGQLQYTRRNYEGAIESFETCKELGEEDVKCDYLRGWAHYFLNDCDQSWAALSEALPKANTEQVLDAVQVGMTNVTTTCAGYSGASVPTAIPPTPIPPTPIGGL